MAKKIYDIKPPKTAHKKEKTRKESKVSFDEVKIKKSVTRSIKDEPLITQHHHKKEEHSIWQSILVVSLIIVVMVGVYLFFKLPKADIVIWPKVDNMSFKQTIIADKTATSVNVAKFVIPAQYFQATKTISQDFQATGSASNEGKATGTITIYNKYDPPASFTFRAGTHFMSDSGKLFVVLQKVVIPAG
ncbi:MAG: hypothetical protein NTY04_00600, partial [Candidatus Staskawiczbacteria bacterium]|nr:hypothetical protein [Candidatus Staskawiczbacteria bacterium]